MNNAVEFALAISNSFPSGTGSYSYRGSFQIVVKNLAFEKEVAIFAQRGSSWQNIPAQFARILPDNLEIWTAPARNDEGAFVARITANGTTHWDNNGGANYRFFQAFDEFIAITGKNRPVVLGAASMGGGNLHVDLGVQNLAFQKVVGIAFTTDGWVTAQTAFANFSRTMKSGLEVWHTTVAIGAVTEVQLAAFYRVQGNEHWDNNFWRNYRVTPANPQEWGETP